MFCRLWGREALPKLPVLGCPGWDTSCRTKVGSGRSWETRLVPGENSSSDRVVSVPAGTGECGSAAGQCAHRTTPVTRSPSPDPVPRGWILWYPSSTARNSLPQFQPVLKKSGIPVGNVQLGHNSHVCIFICASYPYPYLLPFVQDA